MFLYLIQLLKSSLQIRWILPQQQKQNLPKKPQCRRKSEDSTTYPKSIEKADVGQTSGNQRQTEPAETKQSNVQSNSKASSQSQQKTEPTAEKATEKLTEKPTLPTTEKKSVDITSAVNSAICYGKQLGMHYNSSLNTGNASWFSSINASYYDDTQSLIADCYADIEYVAYYYKNDGIVPSDLSFNVVAENNKIYVVYS